MLLCAYCGTPTTQAYDQEACMNVCCLYYGLNQAKGPEEPRPNRPAKPPATPPLMKNKPISK